MGQNDEKPPPTEAASETNIVNSPKPLCGKTVLVTRPHQQSEEMTLRLEGFGAKVIHAPMIAIKEPHSWQAIDEAIRQLDLYDWLIFTSANGVKFFFHRLAQQSEKSMAQISGASVCAIGAATAKALASVGAKIDLIARDSKAEGLLRELIDHLGNSEALRGLRFLLPRARYAREVLPARLRELGTQVDVVEAYQNIPPEVASENIFRLFKDEAIDVITFTSSSTVHNFAALVGKEQLAGLLQNSFIACIGPITKATAEAYHLQNIIQPESYTATALVEAIVYAIGEQ